MQDASSLILANEQNGSMNFWNNGAYNLNIAANGNVGIGTTNPIYKLDVNGIVRTNSGFTKAGGWRLLTTGWGPDVLTVKKNAWDGSTNDNY